MLFMNFVCDGRCRPSLKTSLLFVFGAFCLRFQLSVLELGWSFQNQDSLQGASALKGSGLSTGAMWALFKAVFRFLKYVFGKLKTRSHSAEG